MKVAHILPPRVLAEVPAELFSDTHLLLPRLMKDEQYREFYKPKQMVDYLIMDNGIAEGDIVSFRTQLAMAKSLNVQEVVLPDAMKSSDKTLELLIKSYAVAFTRRHEFRFMFVAQGKTINEVIHCAEQAFNMCPGIISTVGIPRHILSVSPSARAQIAHALRDRIKDDFEIHLLGTHPDDVVEISYYAGDYKAANVRSVDTSLAWNATREEVELKDPTSLNYNISVGRQHIEAFARASLDHAALWYIKLLVSNMEAINTWVK